MIARILTTTLAVGALTLGGALWFETKARAKAEALAASQARTITALQEQAAQSRLAADVARAEAEAAQARAAEFDAIREALLKGSSDVPLPDWFHDHLRRLGFGGVQ